MSATYKVLAYDFGASSGRAMLFTYDGKKLDIEEMHRFSNDPVMVGDNFYWDILRLFHEVKTGILKTINAGHTDIMSIGFDTWGVDFGLFDEKGRMLGNPYHYRDKRTEGMLEKLDEEVGKKYVFERTGIEFAFFNTLFQLMAMRDDAMLKQAKHLLFIPDIFNYFLTGVMKNEYTEASTSQLLHAKSKEWDRELMEKMNIPADIFEEIVHPGEVVGYLTDELCEELGCPKIPIIAVGSHDTASAVASIPVSGDYSYAFISSGTWALMGAELSEPEITDETYTYCFTNEGSICGKIQFMKNIMGLWIVQECRRQWAREGKEFSFNDLEQAARAAAPFRSFINPDDSSFATPGNMPKRIREFCAKTGQPVPETEGEIIRCAMESLALKCRMVADALEDVQGKQLDVIHMLGGGIKDTMLCEFISCATKKKVAAGPVEATSTGNAAIQFMALGKIENLQEARKIIRDSFPITYYEPADSEVWDAAYETYKQYVSL
ncbi:MAG: rhamnulokinase [Ruminococcaceae bacterium]|nr:rhamnulokinase [Oscillospiraceae bacterium]